MTMVESVFSNFCKLQEILKRYEDTIRFGGQRKHEPSARRYWWSRGT
jgi:hypothetical protein